MELVSSHITEYGGDPYLVSEWLQNAGESKESGPVEDLLEDLSRVKIMTIHQSKGLEFNTVIIYDLRPGLDREKYYSDEYSGIVAKRDKDFINSPSRKIIGKSEKHNFSLNEESRILYVAFTRAKNELHVILSEKELKDEKAARKADDLVSLFQRTLGLWRESGTKERNEAIERMSINPSKVAVTDPIERKRLEQNPAGIRRLEGRVINLQRDDDNEKAIKQFLKEKGDRIKEFRIYSMGSRITISDQGIKIYEDRPVPNNYFVSDGKISYVL